ncbi:MAG: CaiB/BaiF CoA transferase family protein [Alsobacter sp.]
MGPLAGTKIVEMAGIGPGPFCAMLLADMGADVIRIERPGEVDRGVNIPTRFDLLNRGKRSIALDLKAPEGRAAALRLIAAADGLVEGFRPGVMEALGLGPEVCLAANPRLAYGRMTGWGQDGPLARSAGHDLTYIALAGALDAIGRRGAPPTMPQNLLGDFGGGALYLAMGLLAAMLQARSGGSGQVVDAAIVDGTASLMTMLLGLRQMGGWTGGRGENILDGGAPFYDVYETLDGRYVALAPLEARFYAIFIDKVGLAGEPLPSQSDKAGWTVLRERFTALFRTRTRAEWCALLEGTDACFGPVLDLDEAAVHPHMAARGVFVTLDGVTQPAPAPRFGATPSAIAGSPPVRGADGTAILSDWGFAAGEIADLRGAGVLG